MDGVDAESRGTNTVNLILEMKQNKKDTKAHTGHKHWSLWTLVAVPTAPAARPVGCVSGRTLQTQEPGRQSLREAHFRLPRGKVP